MKQAQVASHVNVGPHDMAILAGASAAAALAMVENRSRMTIGVTALAPLPD